MNGNERVEIAEVKKDVEYIKKYTEENKTNIKELRLEISEIGKNISNHLSHSEKRISLLEDWKKEVEESGKIAKEWSMRKILFYGAVVIAIIQVGVTVLFRLL
jgi:archaellum component FlaC